MLHCDPIGAPQNSPTNLHSLAETIVFESYSPFLWDTLVTGFSSHRSPPSLWTPFYRTSGVPLVWQKDEAASTTRHVLSPESVLQPKTGVVYNNPQTPDLGMSNDCTILSAPDNHLHISCSDCSPSAGTLNLFIRREYTQYHGQLQYAMLPALSGDGQKSTILSTTFLGVHQGTRAPRVSAKGACPHSGHPAHCEQPSKPQRTQTLAAISGTRLKLGCQKQNDPLTGAKHREFEGMIPVITSYNHPSNPQQPIHSLRLARTRMRLKWSYV
jgi:hypothetical protein